MFEGVKSLLGLKSEPPDDHILYRYSIADAPLIERALRRLPDVGVELGLCFTFRSLTEIARTIAEHRSGIQSGKLPTSGDWALVALQGACEDARSLFNNVRFYADGCFDGMMEPDYEEMIADIASTASNHWILKKVSVAADGDLRNAPAESIRLSVSVSSDPLSMPFEIMAGKHFDWTLIYRLNERLPSSCLKRFAVLLDGNATIVFLSPDEIKNLNALCGYHFFYEEEIDIQDITK